MTSCDVPLAEAPSEKRDVTMCAEAVPRLRYCVTQFCAETRNEIQARIWNNNIKSKMTIRQERVHCIHHVRAVKGSSSPSSSFTHMKEIKNQYGCRKRTLDCDWL